MWAYDLVVLLTFVLAGVARVRLAARARRCPGSAALVGGAVFCLMPYRVGQSTGHLLGLVSFLLPAMLLALERRRFVARGARARRDPPLRPAPSRARRDPARGSATRGRALPRASWWKAGAVAAGSRWSRACVVERWAVAGSIGTGRSFAQVDRYSAELSDFVDAGVGSGIEELVFVGWLTPLVALAGLVAAASPARARARPRRSRSLVPCALALGANLPGYESLWRTVPGLDATRVPERLMPIACLALAALVAFGACGV